ncbi:hypothetical protein N2152v2_009240 [Parachlorella kessleri]
MEAAPGASLPDIQAAAAATAEQESLELLEWPALCQQVSCFMQTTLGAEVALRCRLPIGLSQDESEQLLQETEEAQQASLTLRGVYDIRRALAAARAGLVLHPRVLGAVGLTLQAAQQAEAALLLSGRGYPALLRLASGLLGGVPALEAALSSCIQADDGRILDTASERLAAVRAARRDNMADLRRRLDEWARLLHSKGVSERPQVVVRRDRLCIPVRAGRQGELPKGSLTLATSNSGSTLYMEPEPVVALNNRETALAGQEQEEEERVLAALSQLVASHADRVEGLLVSLTSLDIATARARHARWLGATRPAFISREQARATGLVRIPRAWHPLLLQPCLPPLPMPPTVDLPSGALPAYGSSSGGGAGSEGGSGSAGLGSQAGDQVGGVSAGLGLVPELLNEAAQAASAVVPRPGRGGSRSAAQDSTASSSSSSGSAAGPPTPVPTELLVPPGVQVVAVTGPNTGGKTASLKALGLVSLMAKAGCFIPQAPPGAEGPGQAQGAPKLVWFDKVLADLGDGQSLQQSLSTFSGHVRRIRNILAATTPRSLVLLDEVGSGTDPTEGAALAAALLDRLHASAALTYATTHHAELKELASTTPGFVNASVEFDVATLKPTYRLQWGVAGESNALAVAEGLGFSATVVAQARQVAARLRTAQNAPQRSELLQRSLEVQLEEARQQAQAAAAARRAAEAKLTEASEQLQRLQQEAQGLGEVEKKARARSGQASSELGRVLAATRAGSLPLEEAEEALKAAEQEAAAAHQAAMALVGMRVASKAGLEYSPLDSGSMGGSSSGGGAAAAGKKWAPRQGELVRVLRMGGAPGTIVSVSQGQGSGRKVSVQVGTLTMEMRLSDVAPLAGGVGGADGGPRKGVTKRSSSSNGLGGSLVGNGSGSSNGVGGGRRGTDLQEAAKAKEKLRAGAAAVADSEGGFPSGNGGRGSSAAGVAVAVQTSRNTVDVRGRLADDAASEVERALSVAAPGSVLFVVHGVGTGRVRAAVRDVLKRSRLVARVEEQAESLGGCTLAYTKA